MEEKIVKQSMEIILHAGDARLACSQALKALETNDFVEAEKKMQEAKKLITQAHKVQTDVIQKETQGEKIAYSLLFSHAQDTLMTIHSEINIAKHLIKISKSIDERIATLEKRL